MKFRLFNRRPRETDYEKFEKRMRLDHKYRVHYFFEDWKKLAEPILTEIIEKSGTQLEGMIFYQEEPASSISYSSGVAISKIHVNGDGTYTLSIGDKNYSEYLTSMPWKETPDRLALKMLFSLETLYNPRKFLDRRRNQLVREIENRTGRNLKREVADLKINS